MPPAPIARNIQIIDAAPELGSRIFGFWEMPMTAHRPGSSMIRPRITMSTVPQPLGERGSGSGQGGWGLLMGSSGAVVASPRRSSDRPPDQGDAADTERD